MSVSGMGSRHREATGTSHVGGELDRGSWRVERESKEIAKLTSIEFLREGGRNRSLSTRERPASEDGKGFARVFGELSKPTPNPPPVERRIGGLGTGRGIECVSFSRVMRLESWGAKE